jgi:hypothetical protein
MSRYRYTPEVILDLAERRMAGQSHRSLCHEIGADKRYLRSILRQIIPSKYQPVHPRYPAYPQARVGAERIGDVV